MTISEKMVKTLLRIVKDSSSKWTLKRLMQGMKTDGIRSAKSAKKVA